MYELQTTSNFRKKYKKLTGKNKKLQSAVEKTLELLRSNPKYKSLKTHKVFLSQYGEIYSSFVTGDIRIIWMQIENKLVILLLDIGRHSGSKSVYK
ncbi:MAG: type II toxin-antitoxin system YafQ family toxin [Candidatus Melainabacteria bacterium]|nr:type II toxin-antitoxin system YafQ family toxin [Candidatus Melainabacteria bacterium]